MRNTVLVWRADSPEIFTRSEAKRNLQKKLYIGPKYGTIGREAFRGNIKLRYLGLENTVKEIQREAFLNCTSMRKIEMPGVQIIGQRAFQGCVNLEKAEFSRKIIKMEKEAFAGCRRLKSVEAKEESRQTRIEEGTFRECQKLKDIKMSSEITEIRKYAFYKCIDLTSVQLPDSLKNIGASAFYQCAISDIDLPENLEEIGDSAFLKCKNLEYARVPESVRKIEKWAFHGCNRLKVLEIAGDPESLGEWIVNRSTHIRCRKGTRTEEYCNKNGFIVEYL